MLKQIFLVACVKEKKSGRVPAKDLYQSTWFKKARTYVEPYQAPWFILSAKHGLLSPDKKIAPYNETLNDMGVQERRDWADCVKAQMCEGLPPAKKVVILAGKKYRENLLKFLCCRFACIEIPMEGMGIGEQLAWLKKQNDKREDVINFYRLMDELERRIGGKRKLGDAHGRMYWPKRGVYFFFEEGEMRTGSGQGPRIVRVGTHALKAGSQRTLWMRLSQHRGTKDPYGGDHRSSIFRSLVGAALSRHMPQKPTSWGQGSSADKATCMTERPLEQSVSDYLGGMSLLFLPVDDPPGPKSRRGYIERNAISLLSGYVSPSPDPPSCQWLGRDCDREKVSRSGLWNNDYVDKDYDPEFLGKLEELIKQI